MFQTYKRHYIYGTITLIIGVVIMSVTEGDPPSDSYVIGIAFCVLAAFYLLAVGVIHFTGWALGELGYGAKQSRADKNKQSTTRKEQ